MANAASREPSPSFGHPILPEPTERPAPDHRVVVSRVAQQESNEGIAGPTCAIASCGASRETSTAIGASLRSPEEETPLRVPHREDVWIGASLQAVAGVTGDIAFGAGLGLWIDVGEATIELRVSTQFAELSLDPDAVRFVASNSSLAGCWMPLCAGVLSLGACALATGTLLYAEALHLDAARAV